MTAKKSIRPSRAIIAKARKVLAFARQRAAEVQNQMELQNALFTPNGMAMTTFLSEDERRAFLRTDEYKQIRALIAKLPLPPLSDEVIVIRIPPAENGKKKRKARPAPSSAARRT